MNEPSAKQSNYLRAKNGVKAFEQLQKKSENRGMQLCNPMEIKQSTSTIHQLEFGSALRKCLKISGLVLN